MELPVLVDKNGLQPTRIGAIPPQLAAMMQTNINVQSLTVEAALTGHQVLSTMHCNDAAGAIARLDDMGIAPFLISSSVILSCAQRLVRRICSKCKADATAGFAAISSRIHHIHVKDARRVAPKPGALQAVAVMPLMMAETSCPKSEVLTVAALKSTCPVVAAALLSWAWKS